MNQHWKRFWILYALPLLYAGAVLKTLFGGVHGTDFQPEAAPQGALSSLSLTFTAIFLVAMYSCLQGSSGNTTRKEQDSTA